MKQQIADRFTIEDIQEIEKKMFAKFLSLL